MKLRGLGDTMLAGCTDGIASTGVVCEPHEKLMEHGGLGDIAVAVCVGSERAAWKRVSPAGFVDSEHGR